MNYSEKENIERLLERFFEGQTSNVEEQKLYEFFAGYDVPEHLLRYKKVFAYFDIGLNSDFRMNENDSEAGYEVFEENDIVFGDDLEKELREDETPVRKTMYGNRMLWVGVAASLLILILLNPFGFGEKPFDPYEGSYIVRNGERITDLEIIRPELEATMQQVMQQQQAAESLGTKLTTEDSRYADTDMKMQEYYNSIIEGYENESVRDEIMKILKSE